MIQFKDINKTFIKNNHQIHALKDINLEIHEGDIFGVIGYSGAGKSTLLRLVNHLEVPTSGSVLINQEDITQLSVVKLRALKKRIGMIFQHFNLLESKTVAENIALPLRLEGKLTKLEINKRVDELLEYVEITAKKNAYPKELSGGQKQRVGIARALVNRPNILLCDEATSALDPQTTIAILDILRRINDEQKVTIMMITHQMEVIEYLCDHVAIMDSGSIIESGTTLDIFKNPKEQATKNFISTVIEEHLPERILESIDEANPKHIYRLEFLGQSAKTPVINELILMKRVVVNILFANMTNIVDTVIGSMFVQLNGTDADIDYAINFLRERGVRVSHNQSNKIGVDDV